ncbi:MAG: hypothetical protein AB1744_01140 [Candidatus Zixiibacteriota bacterium]
MQEKLEILAGKVEKALELLDSVKLENVALKAENQKLRVELAGIQREFRDFKLGQADQAEVVRSKLSAVLTRLEELESLQE